MILFYGGRQFCVFCVPWAFCIVDVSFHSPRIPLLSPLFYSQAWSIGLPWYWPWVSLSSILCYAVLSHPHIRQAKNSCACRSILIELFCLAPYGSHLSLTRWPLVQMWLQCGCCLRLYSSLSLLWTKAKILSDLMNVYTLWLQTCHGTENEVDGQLLMTFWFLKYLLPTTVLNIII